MIAIGLFIVAVAMDFIEGMDNGILNWVAGAFSTTSERAVHFSKSLEEFWEMLGTTTFLYVFLKKLTSLTPSLAFEFHPRG